jgi:hypothetical protein
MRMPHIPPQITIYMHPAFLHNFCEIPVYNSGEIDFKVGIMMNLADCSVSGHIWEGVKVARILWGMPAYSAEMRRDIDEGKLILGGCCVDDDDPTWQCVKCKAEVYKE